jgi:hypothetical protein
MSNFPRQERTRLLILASLILLSVVFALPQRSASACFECVALTGGLCVGCDPNPTSGHASCTADQSTCSCQVKSRGLLGPDELTTRLRVSGFHLLIGI